MRHGKIFVLTVALVGLGLGEARASFNLGILISNPNNKIEFGDKRFDNFLYSSQGTGMPAATDVGVDTVIDPINGSPGLIFTGAFGARNGSTGPDVTADAVIRFTVTALNPNLPIVGAQLISNPTVLGTGSITVDERVRLGSDGSILSLRNYEINPVPQNVLGHVDFASVTFAPQTSVTITKDIQARPTGANSLVEISAITQNFPQVPEPSGLISGSIGALLLGTSYAWRHRRKVST